ncbi:hypothetical protein DDW44_12690 [Streptomyces tirandamycinicus]|uniref:Uncharacterized protein n=1 Tax=Streptomyces tirandamycinicus TaxID=2174846 RepID=A0A2S1ST06_9ACTN|nr:hypothetical protein DDW44_12690 [Streptomyces tirandamycinicus]
MRGTAVDVSDATSAAASVPRTDLLPIRFRPAQQPFGPAGPASVLRPQKLFVIGRVAAVRRARTFRRDPRPAE